MHDTVRRPSFPPGSVAPRGRICLMFRSKTALHPVPGVAVSRTDGTRYSSPPWLCDADVRLV